MSGNSRLPLLLAALSLPACGGATPPPEPPASEKLFVQAGIPSLGHAEATCVKQGNKLELKLYSTCTTRSPLWVGMRAANPFESDWSAPDREHDLIVPAEHWHPVTVPLPDGIPKELKLLGLNVRAYCVSNEAMLLKHGDARCRLD